MEIEQKRRLFEQVAAQNRSRYLDYAGSQVGASKAEDAVQDALIAAWERIAGWENRRVGGDAIAMHVWLSAVVRHVCMAQKRRAARDTHHLLPIGVDSPVAAIARCFDGPDDGAVFEPDDYEALAAAISDTALSGRERECLMARMGGEPGAKTSLRLGIAQGVVRTHVASAVRKMRETVAAQTAEEIRK